MNGRRRRNGLVVILALILISALGVGPLRPAEPPIPPLSEASVKTRDWMRGVMLGGYDKVGKHNPKWDDDARRALGLAAELWGTPRKHPGIDLAVFEASRRAIDAGCDDPLILYVYARTFRTFGKDPAKTLVLHQRAADALWDVEYSSYYRSLAQFRVAQLHFEQFAALRKAAGGAAGGGANVDRSGFNAGVQAINKATNIFADLAKEANVPQSKWIELGDALETAFKLVISPQQEVERGLPQFEKHAPKVAFLTIKGQMYTSWAWQGRGGGFAPTVTDEGWKLMKERLAVAQAALEEAWTLDPTNSEAAARMITVELGQGQGRERMELWFKRAITADPDNIRAYNDKINYLEPKWYGNAQEMLRFGRECVNEGRFNTDAPLTLDKAHAALSHYTHGGWSKDVDPEYYKDPAVWADLKSVCEGYLRADKDGDLEYTRNRYAHLAGMCGAWDDAAKMFAIIGDKPHPHEWTVETFNRYRQEALEKGKK